MAQTTTQTKKKAARADRLPLAVRQQLKRDQDAFDQRFKQVVDGKVSAVEFLGLRESDARHLLGFSIAMVEKNELGHADAAAELACATDPKSFDAWMVLGSVRARRKEAGKALEAYARAAAIDAKNARLWCDVGEIKLSLFDYEGAAKALSMAIDVDPKAETPGGRRAQALVAKTYAKLSQENK